MSGVHTHVLPSVARRHPSAWQHSLFGCFNDKRLTCMSLICPCITAGLTADEVDEPFLLCGLLSVFPCDNINIYSNAIIRGKVRDKFGIDGSAVEDCLVSQCCLCCASIQQGQEIKTRTGMFAPIWRQRARTRRDRRNITARSGLGRRAGTLTLTMYSGFLS